MKWYALVFVAATILATGLLLPGVQANSIAVSLETAFGINTTVSGVLLVVVLAIIIFGGVKRIVNVARCRTVYGSWLYFSSLRYCCYEY